MCFISRARGLAPALLMTLSIPFLLENTQTAAAQTLNSLTRISTPSTKVALRPGVETPVLIKSTPFAVCTLHAKGAADADPRMNLIADSEGAVRFHLTAQRESTEAAGFEVDCTEAGTDAADSGAPISLTTHTVEVTAGMSVAEAREEPQTPPKGAAPAPAISEAEARSFSGVELARLQYPPRPKEETDPQAFAAWLRIVTTPHTRVPAGLAMRAEVSHHHGSANGSPSRLPNGLPTAGAEGTANWSGIQLVSGNGSYNDVAMSWTIPAVTAELFGPQAMSALWVGFGDGNTDLVQVGTEQNAISGWGYAATSYYAFTEVWPSQATEAVLTGLPVSPGDQVYASEYLCDSNGVADQSGIYQCGYMYDYRTMQDAPFTVPLGSTQVAGSEAEWIMERPWLNGALPDMANYGTVSVTGATATNVCQCNTAGLHRRYLVTNNNLAMYNDYYTFDDNNLLSTSTVNGPPDLLFQWQGYH